MPNHRPFRAMLGGALAAAGLVVLVGCTSAGAAPNPSDQATPAPSPSVEAPAPDPTPTAAALDPADVTTWVITADAVGPIVRGAGAAETVAGLTAFESDEWCPGVFALSQEGVGQIVITALEDGTVGSVWVSGRAGESGLVPDSPATEAGIALGSTMDELSAAYPGLATSNQVGADSYGYATGDEAEGFVNFVVENDRVITIGVHDRASIPKEFCG